MTPRWPSCTSLGRASCEFSLMLLPHLPVVRQGAFLSHKLLQQQVVMLLLVSTPQTTVPPAAAVATTLAVAEAVHHRCGCLGHWLQLW